MVFDNMWPDGILYSEWVADIGIGEGIGVDVKSERMTEGKGGASGKDEGLHHHFIKVLLAVRRRPGMYISPTNLESLRNFIAGYRCSKLFKDENYYDDFFVSFTEWIEKKEKQNVAPDFGWVDLLNENRTELEAFEIFFTYLDEFSKG